MPNFIVEKIAFSSKNLIIQLISIALLSSCSSPRDASKDNFQKIIGKHIANIPSCDAGSVMQPFNVFSGEEKNTSAGMLSEYNFFVSKGFLEVNTKSIAKPSLFVFAKPVYQQAKVYSLTPKGK